MTRLRSFSTILATAATLGAGTAGATTILSGTNSVHVHQSPSGTVVSNGVSVSRSPVPLHRPIEATGYARMTPEPEVAPGLFVRLFLFFMPWSASTPEVEPEVIITPVPTRAIHHVDFPGDDRASTMMRTLMRRMDR